MDTPRASLGTSTCVRPPSERAVTRNTAALAADSTGRFTPRSTRSSPSTRTSSSDRVEPFVRLRLGEAPGADHRAGHEIGRARPDARRRHGRNASATRFVASDGPGAAWRPNSWAITLRSTRPSPLMLPPPLASLTSNDVQPRSAPRRQYSGSKPIGSARSARKVATGTWSSRNRAVVSRKNSCSGVEIQPHS